MLELSLESCVDLEVSSRLVLRTTMSLFAELPDYHHPSAPRIAPRAEKMLQLLALITPFMVSIYLVICLFELTIDYMAVFTNWERPFSDVYLTIATVVVDAELKSTI